MSELRVPMSDIEKEIYDAETADFKRGFLAAKSTVPNYQVHSGMDASSYFNGVLSQGMNEIADYIGASPVFITGFTLVMSTIDEDGDTQFRCFTAPGQEEHVTKGFLHQTLDDLRAIDVTWHLIPSDMEDEDED